MVNPYQGYRGSSADLFPRSAPGTKTMNWTYGYSVVPGVDSPLMEGEAYGYGAINRHFNAGDMYLVARLDGPKVTGQSAVFAVCAD
jgi:hypothetical protein